MDEFSYKLKAEIIPASGKRGDTVTVKASLSDVVGQVRNVSLSIPEYGIWEVLKPSGDNTYTLTYTIPWEAPSGKYEVNVYATSVNGQRGPSATVTFNLA